MTIHIFGIRHHGPGCARSLRSALKELEPDLLLIEGPPEGDAVLPLILEDGTQPPVALLIYRPDMPSRAAFYPFAEFSPEWQALRYALTRSIPARFCDLPQAVLLGDTASDVALPAPDGAAGDGTEHSEAGEAAVLFADDPLGALALAAGYEEFELWWEEQVERRSDTIGLFDAILEAMQAVRSELPDPEGFEARREAHMRQAIRTAEREGFGRIAVVCGAWHAPALAQPGFPSADKQLLGDLQRVKVEATWIPWTNSRLSNASGYGAGIASPGWYGHLWTEPDRAVVRWMARAAHLLRQNGLHAPASGVIDGVRLADALAALRGRAAPGLQDAREAIQTVLCDGADEPVRLIRQELEIGSELGAVPQSVPAVPLQRDLEVQQRRLRLRPDAGSRLLDLDLRTDTDRARSHLLHRLRILGVPWGVPDRVSGKSGTFHELWAVEWQPEFVVRLIEMAVWGNTLTDAASAFLVQHAAEQEALPQLCLLLHDAILADLPDAVAPILTRLQARSAMTADVQHLMQALPPLVQVARYGDVRGTRIDQVMPIIDGLFERAIIGLRGACVGIDDDIASNLADCLGHVSESVTLLDEPRMREEWLAALDILAHDDAVHGLIRGRSCRMLLEAGRLDNVELRRLAGLVLAPSVETEAAAAWIEGLLLGGGFGLLQQDGVWLALDNWLSELDAETFERILPLLRRAFSTFQAAERRTMAERVRELRRLSEGTDAVNGRAPSSDLVVDRERAARVLPVLAQILGAVPVER